jgi:16S rRNA (guanine966-N2)-methyltransferase
MKVNSGTARGRRLRAVPGDTTRPITDIVKQALFNILMDEAPGTRWLDLFGGTGAVGIEALSRGAASCVFLDLAPAAIRTIEQNLNETGLREKARVIRQDALKFIAGRPNGQFDFIYIAPPQQRGIWSLALTALDDNPGWLAEDGTVVAQIAPEEFLALELKNLELLDQRRYGRTMLCFYEKRTTDG